MPRLLLCLHLAYSILCHGYNIICKIKTIINGKTLSSNEGVVSNRHVDGLEEMITEVNSESESESELSINQTETKLVSIV